MAIRLQHFKLSDDTPIYLAGLDGPGDATGPALEIARWIAHLRKSDSVEISDFFTSIYLVFGEKISKYWPHPDRQKEYFVRESIPDQPRDVSIREAWKWLCSGAVYGIGPVIRGRRTLVSGRIRAEAPAVPPISDAVQRLVAESNSIAIATNRSITTRDGNKVGFPTIECVIVCLLDNPEFGEINRLKDSGVQEKAVRRSLSSSD